MSIYTVAIDYTRSLAEMISAGKYDRFHYDIMEDNFPIQRPNVSEVDIKTSGNPYFTLAVQDNSSASIFLLHLNKVETTTQVLAYIDKLGLRPARIEELLALGENYPDKQREFPIVALGTVWAHSNGRRGVPFIDAAEDSQRRLSLVWDWEGGPEWDSSARFAVVGK